MMATTSCGVLILNEEGEVLLGHPSESAHWDLPKGRMEEGESPCEAALRELREEAGIVLTQERLLDLGVFGYRPEKKLHLFATRMSRAEADVSKCTCTTWFPSKRDGRLVLEMDDYRWVQPCVMADYACPSLWKLFATQLSLYELHDRLS